MIFPKGVSGPAIEDGDLVSFKFSDSILTMRLPKIPYNHDCADRVSEILDWTDQDTWQWDDLLNGKQKELVYQVWKYEDTNSHDDIAICILNINVQKLNVDEDEVPFTLNAGTFRGRLLGDLVSDENQFGLETREGWPSAKNDFFLEPVQKPVFNGLKCLLDLQPKRTSHPMPLALFMLNEKCCLSITFLFNSLHYSDSVNPFSEDFFHQLKMDLFNELLAHIQIEYSPELIKKIETMK